MEEGVVKGVFTIKEKNPEEDCDHQRNARRCVCKNPTQFIQNPHASNENVFVSIKLEFIFTVFQI